MQFDFRTPPRSDEQVAELEDSTKRYGRHLVHDHVSLTIRRHERWCVMVKNGKTDRVQLAGSVGLS